MKKIAYLMKVVALTVSMMGAVSAHADAASEMAEKLKKLYPSTTITSVRTSALPNLFEVVMGENIAYVEPSGRYFMFGRLYDMPNQLDMTGQRLEEINRVDSGTFDVADAIKQVKGNGRRKLYVFSDPDCPFCKKLERDLKDVTDVTIYTFLMPLESLHPDAHRKAVNVWCSKDQVAAWDELMVGGKEAPKGDCKNPVDKIVDLARKLRINGTPTMFSEDGRKLAGAVGAQRIDAFLNQPAKTAAK